MGADRVNLFADYGVHAWYLADERVDLGVGLTGRLYISGDDLSVAERMLNQVGMAVIGRFERVQPGVHLRVPFDFVEHREEVDYVLGLSLAVPLSP
jgi:hypothetical protein